VQPTLETERLLLRPFTAHDAADVQRLAGVRAIADTTLNIPHPYKDGVAEDWIATHASSFESGTFANFAITQRDGGDLVGAIGLAIERRFDRAEIGYWIGVPYWRRGYCTEAAGAVVAYGFSTLGLNRIHANHLARNPASGRVMQKLGMMHEGIARGHVLKWGIYEDLVLYGLLKETWLARGPHGAGASRRHGA
jgi:RimJ/RimL family protein N-acetyltransferase